MTSAMNVVGAIQQLEQEKEDKRKKKHKPVHKVIESPVGFIRLDSFMDNVNLFWKHQPFFYDKGCLFWMWSHTEKKYENVDEVDIMNMLDAVLGLQGQTVSGTIKSNYLEAFKRVGRLNIPRDAPVKWVQFKGKAYSLHSGKTYDVTPHYFFTNPIPWDMGETDATPTLDKLFEEWVGKDYVNTLYQVVAYCCYREYPIHLIACMIGSGRNGKTQFQKVLIKFLGIENITSTELDSLIDSKFESFKLYKKLVCTLGETNFGTLAKTSLIKKLVGNDLISFEKKNKTPFDDFNYAKVIINSNSLPSSDDTSEGFYRRWLIIDFPNNFKEGKDIVNTIPEEEYNNLANKICKILKDLIDKGEFTNQGTIPERQSKYIMASNPLPFFLQHLCESDIKDFIGYNEFYNSYIQFLKFHKKRRVKMKEFKTALSEEGFFPEKCQKKTVDVNGNDFWKSGYYVEGVNLRENWKELIKMDLGQLGQLLPTLLLENSTKEGISNPVLNVTNVTKNPIQTSLDVETEAVFDIDNPHTEIVKFITENNNKKEGVRELDVVEHFKANEKLVYETIDLLKSRGVLIETKSGWIKKEGMN